MKLKNIIIISIILSSLNIVKAEETNNDNKNDNQDPPKLGIDYPGIECGKKNPKKDTDCTKYGTDSGMLCCFVDFSNGNNSNNTKICTLLYDEKAGENKLKILGKKKFKGEYWSCGNKSFYLTMNIFIILISIFLY